MGLSIVVSDFLLIPRFIQMATMNALELMGVTWDIVVHDGYFLYEVILLLCFLHCKKWDSNGIFTIY